MQHISTNLIALLGDPFGNIDAGEATVRVELP